MGTDEIRNRAATAFLEKIAELTTSPVGPFGGETDSDMAALSACYHQDQAEIALVLPNIVAAIAASPIEVAYSGAPAIPRTEVQWARDLGHSLLGRSHTCRTLTGFAHFASFDALVHALPEIRAEIRANQQ